MESLKNIATRIKGLREMSDISVDEMAEITGKSVEEYIGLESGEKDFSFTFLYNCAKKLGVGITDILTGISPTLSYYSIERAGSGLPINRRRNFTYMHVAPYFKHRIAEPFVVSAPYIEEQQNKEIELSSHKGQEMDFILEGSLKCNMDGHIEILNAGDTIYYDSSRPHGMIATGGSPCKFLAIVMEEK
ncbi:MAG: XRE family transcriptional regulator [Clostridia bacterium]|nr:XRE family transcriptional regulator [Clostridia bacterium]